MNAKTFSLVRKAHAVRPLVEIGQATVEWTMIAALIATLMVPACFGVWVAAGGMYGSLDDAVDVTPAAGHSTVAATYNINFYRIVLGADGTVDLSTLQSFGDDWNQSLHVGEAIAIPPLSYGSYTFDHWAKIPDWYNPVSVAATCPSQSVNYVAVFK